MPDWDRTAGPVRTRDQGAAVFLEVGAGVGLVTLMHGIAGIAMGGLTVAADAVPVGGLADVVRPLPFLWLMLIGLGQLPYVVPAAIGLWFVRRPLALGVVVGAALTFTLNGACFGLLFGSDLLG